MTKISSQRPFDTTPVAGGSISPNDGIKDGIRPFNGTNYPRRGRDNLRLRMAVGLILLAASLGLSSHAHATHWTVCNRTAEDLNIAIAYVDNENLTATEGWHGINKCGGCAVVLNFD